MSDPQIIHLDVERARRRPEPEPWLRKAGIAKHLGFSTRWVEMRLRDGMPSELWGGERRFRVTDVEAWLRDHYHQDSA